MADIIGLVLDMPSGAVRGTQVRSLQLESSYSLLDGRPLPGPIG